ncbi:hypothetical protein EVAR_80309_1 [Eumeta japonica]|uniref:Uncharacterized protein n=1 Tax=Eumeta variegata TaxID=151549 RepID=A0A4C1UCL2_EUMVA|nr:hypothetical protein EVAR_80309_1 [Eumeta japonica]
MPRWKGRVPLPLALIVRAHNVKQHKNDAISKKANITRCSQAVTHPSTDRARRCLTSVVGREPVDSAWYGRWRRRCKRQD